MTTSIMNSICARLALGLAVIVSTVLGQPALAQSKSAWTTVGSAGIVNESHFDLVDLSGGGIAQFQAGAPANTSALIRYNVTATSGLFGLLGTPIRMNVRFMDNNASANVIVRLKEYNFDAGLPATTIIEFNSNEQASSASLQNGYKMAACGFAFDFANKAYYLEVELNRTAASGNPKLATVQLSAMPGTCVA